MPTNVWQTGSSNNWSDPTNWSLGHVPLLTEDVQMADGGSHSCQLDTDIQVNSLSMYSSQSFHCNGYDITTTYSLTVGTSGNVFWNSNAIECGSSFDVYSVSSSDNVGTLTLTGTGIYATPGSIVTPSTLYILDGGSYQNFQSTCYLDNCQVNPGGKFDIQAGALFVLGNLYAYDAFNLSRSMAAATINTLVSLVNSQWILNSSMSISLSTNLANPQNCQFKNCNLSTLLVCDRASRDLEGNSNIYCPYTESPLYPAKSGFRQHAMATDRTQFLRPGV